MNVCKYDIYFIITLCFIIYLYFNQNKNEGFQSTTGYQADVEAIRNLSNIATQLTTSNTLTMPGLLNVSDTISVNKNRNEGGRISIRNSLKDGKKDQTNDWTIWNMTGDYGNKLSFWRYNGDGTNAGPLMDLNDNSTVKINGKISTNGMDPNNMPDNWGGGIRTWDVYASGTIACGPDGKQLKSYINSIGDGYFSNNLSVGGNVMFNTFYRKYMNAGVYQVKGYGRFTDLKYGWTILWEDNNAFNISARLSLYEKISGRNGFVTVSPRDLRPGVDGNWHPHRLVVFPGYCVRFYYWDQPSIDNCKFNAGYYDWLNNRFIATNNQCIHLIHVTLDSEGMSNFDDLTCIKLSDYNLLTDRFPVKLPGKTRFVNEAWYTDA